MRAWWTLHNDLQRPRSIAEILGASFSLYARYPLLFLALALAVTGPYELIVLATLGTAPIGAKHVDASTALILVVIDVALIAPLISALYAHAAVMIDEGERPSARAVVARVVRVLPVVAAAEIAAGFGIGLGLLAFLIPGIYLLVRWAVVAQVAALEHTDWMGALRRGADLTRGNFWHVLGVLILTTVVNLGLSEAAAGITGGTRASDVVIGIAVATIVRSFTALTTAVLYFDLLARQARAGWPEDT